MHLIHVFIRAPSAPRVPELKMNQVHHKKDILTKVNLVNYLNNGLYQ